MTAPGNLTNEKKLITNLVADRNKHKSFLKITLAKRQMQIFTSFLQPTTQYETMNLDLIIFLVCELLI